MKTKAAFVMLLIALSLILFFRAKNKPVREALGQGEGPEILLYTGENFTGRVVSLDGKLLDLPQDEEPDGSIYDWNDQIRSIIVVSGTWRLYQNGRMNTLLDDMEADSVQIAAKPVVEGWSALVSATSRGPLEIPDLAQGGIGEDISSVELISSTNLPDWALGFRK